MCVCFAPALAVEDISAFVDVLNERCILDSFCALICFLVLFFLSPPLPPPLLPLFICLGGKKKKSSSSVVSCKDHS